MLSLVATLTDPSGAMSAGGAAASRLVDTNFVFHLSDVSATGAATLITRGYLKASHRQSHADPAPIALGTPITYSVPLWHVDYRVPAGHHLELLLESGDQECCLSAAPAITQPLLPLTVTVRTGTGGSTVTIPTFAE